MDTIVLVVFGLVYLGMFLGDLPGLALDRTGVALLGAIALIATGRVSLPDAWTAIDVPTIALLLGLMVVSAQFRLGGFYSAVAQRLAAADASPATVLLLVILASAVLSALLANDIVCLAFAPLLIEGCLRRGLRPQPYLLGLACASNVGSAATLIGNPQNMLIGQRLNLSFAGYLLDGVPPAAIGCLATWWIIARLSRDNWWQAPADVPVVVRPLNQWQSAKGALVTVALVVLFVEGSIPREVAALAAAGVLMMSRRLHSREMLALVDWQLLVLFVGLFVVNHALAAHGILGQGITTLSSAGIELRHPGWLFGATVGLSNLVSNVPAVILLLPTAEHRQAGAILALASTLAGNLLIVGSIANIIVVDQAARLGVRIGWREHARVGIPVTVVTLGLAGGWLLIRSAMG